MKLNPVHVFFEIEIAQKWSFLYRLTKKTDHSVFCILFKLLFVSYNLKNKYYENTTYGNL